MSACTKPSPTKTGRHEGQSSDTNGLGEVFYTAHELARLLRLKDFRSVYKWAAAGKIPRAAVTKLGAKVLYRRKIIDSWLAENTGA